MNIVYSALRSVTKNKNTKVPDTHLAQRYQAYRAACTKYDKEIADIQKYLPGWQPPFKVESAK